MNSLTASELKRTYIDFFVKRMHHEIAGSSLIPENDPSVLFTTAGMHPLVPYLLGEKHPAGTRLVDCQKCLRTGDIEEVGDAFHLTFFEMMGNWSLNDYFKRESITMSHEFLTKVLGIPQDRISVTCFAGDDNAPRDIEAYRVWRDLGYPDERIYFYSRKENWWGPAGETGPCGPDTEIFYDTGKEPCCDECQPFCTCGKYVELWNNVFMEYDKKPDGSYVKMERHNVDTGLGLERVCAVINGKESVYDTELFEPIIKQLEKESGLSYSEGTDTERFAFRLICDHLRSAVFVLGDEHAVTPSNVDQGYILRRIIRRMVRYCSSIGIGKDSFSTLTDIVVDNYSDEYPELETNRKFISDQMQKEVALFERTLKKGMSLALRAMENLEPGATLPGQDVFRLYDTYGFPIELTIELANEHGFKVDTDDYARRFAEHQAKSRKGAAQRFRGGLVDNSEETAYLHTATHLLHGALRKVLGDEVQQKGSNITPERLRFDFSFGRKLTPEEIAQVNEIVNQAIREGIDVVCEEMTLEDARSIGAVGVFNSKYDSVVKVYSIGDYDTEICGGPHAQNTSQLKAFKIIKEQSSSAGVRRIKAIIGDKAIEH